MAKRRPSREEERLWHQAMQNTRPIRTRKATVPPAAAAPERRRPPSPPAASAPPAPANGPSPGAPIGARASAAGLDRRTAERLRRGQLAIEASLDLHGHTLEEARRALSAFVAASQASGRRCVLIVTGKGAPGSKKTIRANAPRWLAEGEDAPRVFAITPARPKDGGAGALYVLLRKRKRETEGGRR